jgi:hypothetical protein
MTRVSRPRPSRSSNAAAGFSRWTRRSRCTSCASFCRPRPWPTKPCCAISFASPAEDPRSPRATATKPTFLLVQYFSLCAPSGLEDADVDLDYVAQVLEPVLGPQQPKLPAWLSSLETIMQSAARLPRLSELLHSGVARAGAQTQDAERGPLFRARGHGGLCPIQLHDPADIFPPHARRSQRHPGWLARTRAPRRLTVDCRRAQFSAEEPIARLRMICQSWKVMFHAEYSSGQPLRMLVDLRAAVDDALQNGSARAPLAARAAAASGKMAAERKSRFRGETTGLCLEASRPSVPRFAEVPQRSTCTVSS